MRECTERTISVGFTKKPRKVFDEIEMVTAEMVRAGWLLRDSLLEQGLGKIHLFFERDIDTINS